MNVFHLIRQFSFSRRVLSALTAFFFLTTAIFPTASIAQALPSTILNLPVPGSVVAPTAGFAPAMIKGVNLYPDNPLKFDFIIDKGDSVFNDEEFKKESTRLIKYFLSSLTVPENEMWVNLSPYEKNRIVPQDFGKTEMGRDLLAQDYMLKQLTASLMNPDDKLGGEFWQRVYSKAQEKYGTTDIPMNTFNKIWIVPEKAVVYEHEKGAFVVKSHLKVMLEEDYLALHQNGLQSTVYSPQQDLPAGDRRLETVNLSPKIMSGIQSKIVKDLLIPEIEREVNAGQTFANLRQIYNAVILASWYKQALKESLLGQVFVDQKKTKGVETDDKTINEQIYNRYVESFKKGVYNTIKEDYNPETQEVVNRKYFSGGIKVDMASLATESTLDLTDPALVAVNSSKVEVDLAMLNRRDFLELTGKIGAGALGVFAGFRPKVAKAVTPGSTAFFVANNIRYEFSGLTDPKKAGQAFDKRLNQMLEKYRTAHQGKVVSVDQNLPVPELAKILESVPQGATFEEVAGLLRKTFSALYQANDRTRLPQLELEALRWMMDFWKFNTRYDSFLDQKGEKGKFMAVYNTVAGNPNLKGLYTYVCESFSDLIVLTAHEIGLGEKTITKIPIYQDSLGNLYPNSQGIGHVALLFTDATGKKLFADQGFLPEHKVVGAWSEQGKFERIAGGKIKTRTDLKGETFQQLLETQQAWVKFIELNEEMDRWAKEGAISNLDVYVKSLESIQQRVDPLTSNPALNRHSDLKANAEGLKKTVERNLKSAQQEITNGKEIAKANKISDKHNEFLRKFKAINEIFQEQKWEDAAVEYKELIHEISPYVDAVNQQPVPEQITNWKDLVKGFNDILKAAQSNLTSATRNLYVGKLNALGEKFNQIIPVLNESQFTEAFPQLQQLQQEAEQLNTEMPLSERELKAGLNKLLSNIDSVWKTGERNNRAQQFNGLSDRLQNAVAQFNNGKKSEAVTEISLIKQETEQTLLPNVSGMEDDIRKGYEEFLQEVNRLINQMQGQKVSSLNVKEVYVSSIPIPVFNSGSNIQLALNVVSVSALADAAMMVEEVQKSPADIAMAALEAGERNHTLSQESPGGIDLNPTILNTEIKRNGHGVIIPAFKGVVPDLEGMEGFVPNIINVTPVTNLQLLLGLDTKSKENPRNPDNEKPVDVSYNLSALPAKEREEVNFELARH